MKIGCWVGRDEMTISSGEEKWLLKERVGEGNALRDDKGILRRPGGGCFYN